MSGTFLKIALLCTAAFSCEWYVSDNNGGEYLLDLTPLTNITMTTNGDLNDDYVYIFTPCNNGLRCPGISYDTMAIQSSKSNKYNCEALGFWDSTSEPSMFYNNKQAAFSFNYQGIYNYSICQDRLQWNPIFLCNPYYEYQIGTVFEPEQCIYTVNIFTKYACIDKTTTWFPFSSTWNPWISSTGIFGECGFETDDGKHKLNLENVAGQEIKYQDSNSMNDDLYYVYTPCTNTFRCDNDIFAMAYLFNISSFECNKYLAQWEDGMIEPTYSEELKTWEFVYTNGEPCNGTNSKEGGGGLQNVFVVDWICDPHANQPKITQAQQNGCVYTMNINSTIACH
mmetsp:Transcript_63682/g.57330  ORF Transcript_63682/g.57330 Transcript_63682/m.57330 type:complete len:339 (-) Transcript_63682:139-1155(-)